MSYLHHVQAVDIALLNFLVIGAGRTGTTPLGRNLGRHPEVFVAPAKAPSSFSRADVEHAAAQS